MENAGNAEYVVSVHVGDQYPHFPVEAELCDEELLLCSFSAVEHYEASVCSDRKAWEVSLLRRDTAPCA
jgi:hypothetical protein